MQCKADERGKAIKCAMQSKAYARCKARQMRNARQGRYAMQVRADVKCMAGKMREAR